MSRPFISEEDWRKAGYGEDAIRQRLGEIFNQVILEHKFPFGRCDVQVKAQIGSKQKYCDMVVWKQGEVGTSPAFLIELKIPCGWSPLDEEFVDNAFDKAAKSNLSCPRFGTWTVNEFVLWQTFDTTAILDRRKAYYRVADVRQPSDIDRPEFGEQIGAFAERLFTDLLRFDRGEELPTVPIDEFFIILLQSVVAGFLSPIAERIASEVEARKTYRDELDKWFVSQGWTPRRTFDDFERVGRQFLYLVLNKIIFYNIVLKAHPRRLRQISVDGTTGDVVKRQLQAYFDEARQVTGNYENIFSSNFLETVPIPDSVADRLSREVSKFARYDFSRLEYRDIGRILDRLIPDNERHKLGQYFTPVDVVDLINGLTIDDADNTLADFGCGAGTFLVRAYSRLHSMDPARKHRALVGQVYGVDISKFPALLATINMARLNLEDTTCYPQVFNRDFFKTEPNRPERLFNHSYRAKSPSHDQVELAIPSLDAVVGNPPYTRQEELEDYVQGYKSILEAVVERDWSGRHELNLRAGIHAYFMLHAFRFLKQGGRIGYLTADSWLDAGYGDSVRDFLLQNSRIRYVIESKVERWFADAEVNTCILVADRCADPVLRRDNTVRFVQLEVPLSSLLPQTNDEEARFEGIDRFVKGFASEPESESSLGARVRAVPQTRLAVSERDDPFGLAKRWTVFLRAPEVFFRLLRDRPGSLKPLGKVARVTRGIRTGNNSFFYLDPATVKRFHIEKRFRRPLLKGPKEVHHILIDEESGLSKEVLSVAAPRSQLKGFGVLDYIRLGESRGVNKGSVTATDGLWYNLGLERRGVELLIPEVSDDRFLCSINKIGAVADQRFAVIQVKDLEAGLVLAGLLNSSLGNLHWELYGRTSLGGGGLDLPPSSLTDLPIPDPSTISKSTARALRGAVQSLAKRRVGAIAEELGATDSTRVTLTTVLPDRRRLDQIVMGEILGLADEEQLSVYKALLDLVKSRGERSQSVPTSSKSRKPEAPRLAEGIVSELDLSGLRRFPDDYVGTFSSRVREIPETMEATVGRDLHGPFVQIGDDKLAADSVDEARYVAFAAISGHSLVRFPARDVEIRTASKEFGRAYESCLKALTSRADELVPDLKLRTEVVRLSKRLLIDRIRAGSSATGT